MYGRVSAAPIGRDGKIRTVTVTYRNHNEVTDRTTKRAVRKFVIIHPVDELNIVSELGWQQLLMLCICVQDDFPKVFPAAGN